MNLMLNGGGSYQEPGTRHVENSPCRGRVISCFTLDYFQANPIQLHRIWNYYFQAQFHRILEFDYFEANPIQLHRIWNYKKLK